MTDKITVRFDPITDKHVAEHENYTFTVRHRSASEAQAELEAMIGRFEAAQREREANADHLIAVLHDAFGGSPSTGKGERILLSTDAHSVIGKKIHLVSVRCS